MKLLNNSYSPYSNFRVGAAILLKDGTIIKGTNIENASYGMSMCAERVCMFNSYSQGFGKDDIVAMAISGDTEDYIYQEQHMWNQDFPHLFYRKVHQLVFSQRNCSNKIELFMKEVNKAGKKAVQEFRASFCLKEYAEGPGDNALSVVKRLINSI